MRTRIVGHQFDTNYANNCITSWPKEMFLRSIFLVPNLDKARKATALDVNLIPGFWI